MYVSRLRQWQCAISIIVRFGIDKYEQINNEQRSKNKTQQTSNIRHKNEGKRKKAVSHFVSFDLFVGSVYTCVAHFFPFSCLLFLVMRNDKIHAVCLSNQNGLIVRAAIALSIHGRTVNRHTCNRYNRLLRSLRSMQRQIAMR